MNTLALRSALSNGEAVVFDLSARAKFTLTGADRVRYLNGQVSNDVRKLKPHAALPACVMTAKGKMNAFVWVALAGDALFLDTDAALRDSLSARLERYIISDDVTLADVTDERRLLHVIAKAPERLAFLQSSANALQLSALQSRRYGMEGVDISGSHEGVAAFLQSISATEAAPATEETFRIEQGIPRWEMELNENTIPVEAGLETSSIDYRKGCYIGQEVISRIKSVGHVNRHLTGFVCDGALSAGAGLFIEGAEKEAGTITSAAWSHALNKTAALGYLKRDVEAQQLRVGAPDGPVIEVRPLPLLP